MVHDLCSIVHGKCSIVLSFITHHSLLIIVHGLWSMVHFLLSIFYCPQSMVHGKCSIILSFITHHSLFITPLSRLPPHVSRLTSIFAAMMRLIFKNLSLLLLLLLVSQLVKAQDTLPRFTVEDKGAGRIVVSWSNPYDNLVQLAVQRSYDSLKKFTSVYSATSPELPLNGFSDKITPGVKIYYRIFYVMRGGTYYFTKSMLPGKTIPKAEAYDSRRDQLHEALLEEVETATADSVNDAPFYLKTKEGVVTLMPHEFKSFRDSILTKTNDTLLQIAADTVLVQPYSPPFVQRSSQYIFTDRDGFIVVKLPDAATKKYEVIFLEENDSPVLELRGLKESQVTIDKTNFYHGGWYKFELRENGHVIERNKIFLPTDF